MTTPRPYRQCGLTNGRHVCAKPAGHPEEYHCTSDSMAGWHCVGPSEPCEKGICLPGNDQGGSS